MASAKNKKPSAFSGIKPPECPVCLEDMCAPIYQCMAGHSICSKCNFKLSPPSCPICREPMTQTRNWQLEEFAAKLTSAKQLKNAGNNIQCPNKAIGCSYIMAPAKLDDHLKKCIFRSMNCPLKNVSGNCSWNGQLKELMQHCKDNHEANCNVSQEKDIELKSVNLINNMLWVYVTSLEKIVFIITIKMDTAKNITYWAIQLVGSSKIAQQHIYEIHLISKVEQKRKVVFSEHCFSDAMTPDEVFNTGKCAMLPLDTLPNFVKNQTLTFMFTIKRLPPPTKKNEDENQNSSHANNDRKPFKKGWRGPKHNNPNARNVN